MLPEWLAHLHPNAVSIHAATSGAKPEDYVVPELRDRGRLPAEETADYDYLTMGEDGRIVGGTFDRGVIYTANL